MPAKKQKKKVAKVELDGKTVHHFEAALREGLVGSGAVLATHNTKTEMKSAAKVQLHPAIVARFSEILRHGLVASGAVLAGDVARHNNMTGKVKGRRAPSRAK